MLDNTPVRDAVLTAIFRGKQYPLTAQLDGGYAFTSKTLALPGSAAIEFKIAEAGAVESVVGTLQIAAPGGRRPGQSGARQLGWWALNIGVCIGFLLLIARRRGRVPS